MSDINTTIPTDKSFHVIGRNRVGIPDQLILRSSSAKKWNTGSLSNRSILSAFSHVLSQS